MYLFSEGDSGRLEEKSSAPLRESGAPPLNNSRLVGGGSLNYVQVTRVPFYCYSRTAKETIVAKALVIQTMTYHGL